MNRPLSFLLLDKDRIILDCNDIDSIIFGWSKDDLIGKDIKKCKLFSEVDLLNILKRLQELNNNKKYCLMNIDTYNRDVSKNGLEIQINLIQFRMEYFYQILFLNPNKTSDLLQKIKNQEKKYKEIINSFKEGYYEVDLKGNFKYVNECFCSIFGYPYHEIINSNFSKYCNTSTRTILKKKFNDVFTTNKTISSFTLKLLNNNEKEIYLDISISPEYNSRNEIIRFYGISRDITDKVLYDHLKDDHEKVQQRTMELEQILKNQKLYLDEILTASRFKSEFMATMSHELRTPLNSIIGFSELIIADCMDELSDELLSFITEIHDSGRHLLKLINDILDIQKIESGKLEVKYQYISLNSILKSLESKFKPIIIEKGLYFIIKGLTEEKKIFVDPLKLKQILLNLISNSIKFTIRGGIEILVNEGKEEWCFQVKDTGIGIKEEDFKIVFQEFKRGNNPLITDITGTGLGLPLTKRLVELHNGSIKFTSICGKGTTFTVTIPKNY